MHFRPLFPLSLAFAAFAAAGCPNGDDHPCGAPWDGSNSGIQTTTGSEQFTYGNFTSIHAGDCGRESITIDATQITPTVEPFHLVMCVARADHIGTDPLPLAGDSGDGVVEWVDASARAGDCTFALDFAATPSGTATFAGYCDAGGSSYMLTLDGMVAGTRTCGLDAGAPVAEPITIRVTGTVVMLGE